MAGDQTEPMRSLVRVLMRGDRPTGREGELGTAAVIAACEQHGIPVAALAEDVDTPAKSTALELIAYAYGYAVGLNDDWLTVDHLCDSHAAVVREGYEAGLAEDPDATLPADVGERTSWNAEAIKR